MFEAFMHVDSSKKEEVKQIEGNYEETVSFVNGIPVTKTVKSKERPKVLNGRTVETNRSRD